MEDRLGGPAPGPGPPGPSNRNFKTLSPALFTTSGIANQPFELVVHVAFGALLSLALLVPATSVAPAGTEPARTPAPARASA